MLTSTVSRPKSVQKLKVLRMASNTFWFWIFLNRAERKSFKCHSQTSNQASNGTNAQTP